MGQEVHGAGARPWAERVYDECATQLVLYGRALGLGHAESEDVLHDTFRHLLELDHAPEEARFYVLRSFRNRALNHRRSLWRRLTRELESKRWFEPAEAVPASETAAMRELTRLPAEQREVIVLKFWHRLTFEEIARLLGLSPNTAAGRYRYGMARLRRSLSHEDADHESEPESESESEPLPRSPGSGAGWLATAAALGEPSAPTVR